jgi:murein L,D-transpeptidase YafK
MNKTFFIIVIHGYCASIGCFAINNDAIEELYGLLLAALDNQQDQISVHIFPFNLTSAALQNHMGQKEDRDWIIFNEMTKTKSNFR